VNEFPYNEIRGKGPECQKKIMQFFPLFPHRTEEQMTKFLQHSSKGSYQEYKQGLNLLKFVRLEDFKNSNELNLHGLCGVGMGDVLGQAIGYSEIMKKKFITVISGIGHGSEKKTFASESITSTCKGLWTSCGGH